MTVPSCAALYLRVSTARQAEHDVSIPDQKRLGLLRDPKTLDISLRRPPLATNRHIFVPVTADDRMDRSVD